MKTVEINGSLREAVGKKATKAIRKDDMVPCVLYGGDQPVHFQTPASELRKIVYTPAVYIIDLKIGVEKQTAIIQDIQFHPVEERIMHVDFLKVSEDKPVKIDVPVAVEGYAKGMRAGGKMKLNLRRLKVRGLLKDLPDAITINIDDLELGQSIKAGQVKVDNLVLLNSKSVPVVTIIVTRAARAAATADNQ